MSIESRLIVGVALALLPWQAALSQPDTVPPAGATERAFTFQSGALELAGTLTLPEGVERPPITVIVAGSGPTDRNGNQGEQHLHKLSKNITDHPLPKSGTVHRRNNPIRPFAGLPEFGIYHHGWRLIGQYHRGAKTLFKPVEMGQ